MKRKKEVAAVVPQVDALPCYGDVTFPGEGTVMCRNLRPAPGAPGRLVPVEDFGVIATGLEGMRVIGTVSHPVNGKTVLLARGTTLCVVTGAADASARNDALRLESSQGEPVATLEVEPGRVTVACSGGMAELRWTDDGRFLLDELNGDAPAALLTSSLTTRVAAEMPGFKLKDEYTRSDASLSDTDAATLARRLRKVYRSLVDSAAHAGFFVRPVLARYRYIDYAGRTVYKSPVKLLLAPDGPGLAREFATSVADGRAGSVTVDTQAFAIGCSLPEADEQWNRRVAALAVDISPEIPLIDPSALTVENRISAVSGTLRFFMPGMAVDMGADTECLKKRIERAFARFESICREVARINSPFGTAASTSVMIDACGDDSSGSTASESKVLRLLDKSVEPSAKNRVNETILAALSLPHRFTASAGAVSGEGVLWGDVTSLPSRGWDVREWATEVDPSTAWHACVVVEMADGARRAVWSGQGADNAPVAVTPLWHYPDENAASMEIRVSTSRGTAVHRMPLAALAGRGAAVSKVSALQPVRLQFSADVLFSIPAHKMPPVAYRGVVAGATASDPLSAVSVARVSESPVAALAAATASGSAWDFARSRFYAFGKGGVHLVVASASGAIVSRQRLHPGPVEDAAGVAVSGTGGEVAAISGGHVVKVKGAAVTKQAGSVPDGCSGIGFDGDDLWLAGSDARVAVRPASQPGSEYLRDVPSVASLFSMGGGTLFIVTRDGELLDSTRRTVTAKEVEWSCRVGFPDIVKPPVRGTVSALMRLTAIGLRLVCSAVKARFVASGDCGSASLALTRVILSVLLDGSLKSALWLPVRSQGFSWVTITLKGTVSADARLYGVSLNYDS